MYSNNLLEENAVDFAYFLLLEGRKAQACKVLAQVQNPKTTEYFYNLALCEYYAENYLQAANNFEKVLQTLPLNMAGNDNFNPQNESYKKLAQMEAVGTSYHAPLKMGYSTQFAEMVRVGAMRILADLYGQTGQADKLKNIANALKKQGFFNISI